MPFRCLLAVARLVTAFLVAIMCVVAALTGSAGRGYGGE